MKDQELDDKKHMLEVQKLLMEEKKFWFDYHKHMTTLNTGVIIIIATLLEKVFTNININDFNLIAISFYSFLGSIMLSAIGLGYHMPSLRLVVLPDKAKGANRIQSILQYTRIFLMVMSLVCFLSGMVFFISFALNSSTIVK